MSNQPLSEASLMGNIKNLLDFFGNELANLIRSSSEKAQEEIQIRIANNHNELLSLKSEVEAAKTMLQSQAEYFTGQPGIYRAMDREADTVTVKKSDENLRLEQDIYRLQDNNRSLTEKHTHLEHLLEILKSEHKRLESKHEEVNQKFSTAQRNLEDAERRARASRAQVSRLQGHLTKNATNANELIDSHIKGRLEFIRARTQSLVKKFCVGKVDKVVRPSQDFADCDLEWAEKEKSLLRARHSQEDVEEFRTYWVRSKIYKVLEEHIFSYPVFGLEDDLEEDAVALERLIAKGNPSSDISDWRALTLRYTKSLGMTHRKLPEETATHLLNFFYPWVVGDDANLSSSGKYRAPLQLKLDLAELCQAAYDLAVMLRQSTDRYHFVSIEEQTKVESQEQEDFEPEDMIGPKAKYLGSKVWVTLFGALVKESQAGERHIMVKARVICRAPIPLPDRPGSPKKRAA